MSSALGTFRLSLVDYAVKKLYQYIDQQVEGVRPFRAIVTGQSSGMVQIRRIHATTGETALRARVIGFDLATDDEVLCVPMADGLPVVVGKLQRATASGYTVTTPLTTTSLIAVASNTPDHRMANQNSADTASNASTSNYVTTLTDNFPLGTGTWTVRVISSQMLSHSSSGGVVRAYTRIGGTAGTSLSAAVSLDPIRSVIVTQAVQTGQTGTVACDAQYRPNASGTAYSGGGTLFMIAFRTS